MKSYSNMDSVLESLPVRAPFVKCPKCSKNRYGVKRVEPHLLRRQCDACGYPKGTKQVFEPLPRVNKKILYLDQFAFSNMMKSIHPKWQNKHSEPDLRRWRDCYAELRRLVKMQLIACPMSEFHVRESFAWKGMFKDLRAMTRVLSGGVEFRYYNEVEASQVIDSFLIWKGLESDRKMHRSIALTGNVDGWADVLIVLLPISKQQYQPEKLHQEAISAKHESADSFEDVHDRWKSETGEDYSYTFKEERQAYGNALIQSQIVVAKKLMSVRTSSDADQRFQENRMSSAEQNWIRHPLQVLQQILIGKGLDFVEAAKIAQDFLSSKEFAETPHNTISAALWAAKSQSARSGQKSMGPSFSNDHSAISTYLPYCDAMLVDAECKHLIELGKNRGDIAYDTRIFSVHGDHERGDFMTYLQEIRESATWEHKRNLETVFGTYDLQADMSLYEDPTAFLFPRPVT